jgi:hypothetical protein
MGSYSRSQLENWMKTIDVPVGTRVLDIGGAQKAALARTKTWCADDYKVLDLPNPHEAHVPVDIEADIEDDWMGADEGDNGAMYDMLAEYRGKFNIVFCLEVSEYWINPLQALQNIKSLMQKGGTLYISFHFVYPMHNPWSQDCLRYTRAGVMRLLEASGFKEIEISTRTTGVAELINFYKAEGMKMAEGDPEYPLDHEAVGWLIKCKKI